jgi:hypothetical protein
MRLLPFLLAACSTTAVETAPGQSPPPSLPLDGPAAVFVGEPLSLTVSSGLAPNEVVYFARAASVGTGPCLAFAGGVCIDLVSPEPLGSARANAQGVATLSLDVPASVSVGIDVAFQAVVVRGISGADSAYTNAIVLPTEERIAGCTDPAAANFDPAATLDDGSCVDWACSNGTCTQTWVQAGGSPDLDVLLAIDTSESMTNPQLLANNADLLLDELDNRSGNWRVGVITMDMDDPTQSGRILSSVVPGPGALSQLTTALDPSDPSVPGSFDERAFDAIEAALTPPLSNGANAGFRRPGVPLSIGVYSDENDVSQQTTAAFSNLLATLGPPGMVRYNGFVPPANGAFIVCGLFLGGQIAPRHHAVINATGGTWTDFCQGDPAPFFDSLVPDGLVAQTRFELNCPPANPAIEVRVDAALVAFDANDGWTYDPGTSEIVFHGTAVPAVGSTVEVTWTASATCP